MKATLLLASLTLALATPSVIAKSELETLRALCSEQERQIKQLEEENSRLRSTPHEVPLQKAAPQNAIAKSELPHAQEKPSVPDKPTPIPAVEAAPPVKAPTQVAAKTHEVKQGETYYSISRIYGINPTALAAANPKVKATALRPGQVLTLTAGASTVSQKPISAAAKSLSTPTSIPVSTAKAPQNFPSTPPAAESAKPSLVPETKIRAVSVDTKMTFGEFATQHGTNPGRLNELNGLDLTAATVLAKGSELYVPAQP
jgi:LysM repeat protein